MRRRARHSFGRTTAISIIRIGRGAAGPPIGVSHGRTRNDAAHDPIIKIRKHHRVHFVVPGYWRTSTCRRSTSTSENRLSGPRRENRDFPVPTAKALAIAERATVSHCESNLSGIGRRARRHPQTFRVPAWQFASPSFHQRRSPQSRRAEDGFETVGQPRQSPPRPIREQPPMRRDSPATCTGVPPNREQTSTHTDAKVVPQANVRHHVVDLVFVVAVAVQPDDQRILR